jgi:Ca2+-transporting ATPase
MLQVGAYALGLTVATLGAFIWALEIWGRDEPQARTIAFMTLALTQLFHVFNARSPAPVLWSRRLFHNPWVWAAIALTVTLQLLVVYLPPLAATFHTGPLGAADWGLVLTAAALPLVAGQAVKALVAARRSASRPSAPPARSPGRASR